VGDAVDGSATAIGTVATATVDGCVVGFAFGFVVGRFGFVAGRLSFVTFGFTAANEVGPRHITEKHIVIAMTDRTRILLFTSLISEHRRIVTNGQRTTMQSR
jgi:hypothetical protein